MSEEKLAKFQLKSLNLVKSEFTRGDFVTDEIKEEALHIGTNFTKEDSNIIVYVEAHVEIPNPKIKIVAGYHGIFSTDTPSDSEIENFGKINGPAIIFPALRLHIRHLTMEAGMPPLTLPLINFTKINQN